jgi:hypothetical protein
MAAKMHPSRKEEVMPKKEIGEFVSIFRLMWEEIDQQFSSLDMNAKLKVFEVVAPAFVDIMGSISEVEEMDEEDEEHE